MIFFDMDSELVTKPTHSHGNNIRVRNFSLNAVEKSHKFFSRQQIVQVFISEKKYTILLFVDIIDFDQFS